MSGGGLLPRMTGTPRDQSRDTGMAMVLLLLLLRLRFAVDGLIWGAVALQALTMTAPQVFRPVARVWMGLSHVLGAISSRILLGAVFFLVVTPVGLVRRLAGADPMRLREFRRDETSAFVTRRHTFSRRDLEQPY